jgi:RimJ/RimL family protein N-acetyltransferase
VLCFGALNAHRLVTQFPADYPIPCDILESLGMRREGHYRKDRWENGEWQDTVLYALLREEYKQKVAGFI